MTGTSLIMLSFAVTHGVPLLLAVRELRRLGQSGNPGRDEEPPPPESRPKPLPDCLLPQARVKLPVRQLEDA